MTHDLLHLCIGQFVAFKVWPSPFQIRAITVYCEHTDPETTPAGTKLLPLVGNATLLDVRHPLH